MKRSNPSTFKFNCVVEPINNAFRYFNFFSLDAVLVALLWQELLARVAGVILSQADRCLLGLSVWSVYVFDHLLDAFSTTPFLQKEGVLEDQLSNQALRHHFVKSHCLGLAFLLVIAIVGDLFLALQQPSSILLAGLVLGGMTACYLCCNFFFALQGRWLHGREAIIALIFAGGCALVPVMQTKSPLSLLIPTGLLSFLAFLNCLLIAGMERHVPLSLLWPESFPPPLLLFFMACFLALGRKYSPPSSLQIAIGISFVALSIIPTIAKKTNYEVASWATDGALILGPLFVLFR